MLEAAQRLVEAGQRAEAAAADMAAARADLGRAVTSAAMDLKSQTFGRLAERLPLHLRLAAARLFDGLPLPAMDALSVATELARMLDANAEKKP
jgi:hypothetical protein